VVKFPAFGVLMSSLPAKHPPTHVAAAPVKPVALTSHVSGNNGTSDEETSAIAVNRLAESLAATLTMSKVAADAADAKSTEPSVVVAVQPAPKPIVARKLVKGEESLVRLAEHIESANSIVVMCGAGISVSAGIPDFRSPGTGLYSKLQEYQLPRPEAIFEIAYFKQRPEAFYKLCREIWPNSFRPTDTHRFIKLLHDKGKLLRCFTQNIDSLERIAGLPLEKIVAAHGNFDSATCIETGKKVPLDEVEKCIKGTMKWEDLHKKYKVSALFV